MKDQTYKLCARIGIREKTVKIEFISRNNSAVNMFSEEWEDIIEIWQPFSSQMDLYEAWRIYHDSLQETWVNVSISEIEYPDIVQMCLEYGRMVYVYQGIVAGDLAVYNSSDERAVAMFLMGDMQKPMVEISRSKVSGLSLTTLLAINGILSKYQMLGILEREWRELEGWSNRTLKEWKKIEDSQLDIWLKKNQESLFTETFDLFPPMMFCEAASDQSRQYICSADSFMRRGITADHPFILWLLKNAVQLSRYYQRQFQQIVNCLCESSAETIVKECNRIREQLIAFPEYHGVDVSSFPQLCLDDFWSRKKTEKWV